MDQNLVSRVAPGQLQPTLWANWLEGYEAGELQLCIGFDSRSKRWLTALPDWLANVTAAPGWIFHVGVQALCMHQIRQISSDFLGDVDADLNLKGVLAEADCPKDRFALAVKITLGARIRICTVLEKIGQGQLSQARGWLEPLLHLFGWKRAADHLLELADMGRRRVSAVAQGVLLSGHKALDREQLKAFIVYDPIGADEVVMESFHDWTPLFSGKIPDGLGIGAWAAMLYGVSEDLAICYRVDESMGLYALGTDGVYACTFDEIVEITRLFLERVRESPLVVDSRFEGKRLCGEVGRFCRRLGNGLQVAANTFPNRNRTKMGRLDLDCQDCSGPTFMLRAPVSGSHGQLLPQAAAT